MRRSIAALVAVGAAVFAMPASAQNRFYAGGSFGQANYKDACRDISGPGISCDDKDTSWRLFSGYQFHRLFAAEIGYHDLGEIKASNSTGRSASISAKAWDISGVGLLPFASQFAAYGKLGLYYGKTEAQSNFGTSGDDTNTGFTWAAGLQWDPMPPLGIRLEFQQYNEIGGDNSGKGNINVMSLGALWRF